MLTCTVVYVAATLIARLSWLVYCTWVSKSQPKRAAAIISAAGQYFPFRRSPWRKPAANSTPESRCRR